jgi:hypothetical protein
MLCVVAYDRWGDDDAQGSEFVHVLQGNGGEGEFSGGKEQSLLLFECNGGDAGREVVTDPAGDLGKGIHGAGYDCGRIDPERTAGDTCGNIVGTVQCDLFVLEMFNGQCMIGNDYVDFDIFGKIVDEFLSQTYPAGTGNGYNQFHEFPFYIIIGIYYSRIPFNGLYNLYFYDFLSIFFMYNNIS